MAVAALVICASASYAAAQETGLTPDQQREFLLTAKIVSSRPIGRGITGALRLTLSDGSLTHDAAFQSIDQRTSAAARQRMEKRAGELNFVDSYMYNLAAYEISRLLGVDNMMPVTVERRWQGKAGSLSWWVDDVMMDEAEREKSGAKPPRPLDFHRQRMKMTVFAELVGDVDRNQGNIIYLKDWRRRDDRLYTCLPAPPRVALSSGAHVYRSRLVGAAARPDTRCAAADDRSVPDA